MTDERIDNGESSTSRLRQIPRSVWALGLVSLFMDISSEMIHAILPVYLVNVLGASTLTVGFIEGVAEATASITKVFSGTLSDRLGHRKLLVGIGYALAAVTKPVFALANSISLVVGARFVDRIGKGIRGAPRDALIADVTPAHLRGTSFGLRQTLDTVGAFVGPLAAIALMALTANAYRTVFWIATVPAVVAMGILVFGVQEPKRTSTAASQPLPRFADIRHLGAPFWSVVIVASLLTLARFSEAFLLLRARNVGLRVTLVPVVMVVMNVVYASAAYPVGVLADRIGRKALLAAGIVLLIVADLILAFGATIPLTLLGVVFWGLHMGFTQGLFATMVADTAPAPLRGSAFGLFNLVTGVAMLAASTIAGALWQGYGPSATFLAGAVFTAVALVGATRIREGVRDASL